MRSPAKTRLKRRASGWPLLRKPINVGREAIIIVRFAKSLAQTEIESRGGVFIMALSASRAPVTAARRNQHKSKNRAASSANHLRRRSRGARRAHRASFFSTHGRKASMTSRRNLSDAHFASRQRALRKAIRIAGHETRKSQRILSNNSSIRLDVIKTIPSVIIAYQKIYSAIAINGPNWPLAKIARRPNTYQAPRTSAMQYVSSAIRSRRHHSLLAVAK